MSTSTSRDRDDNDDEQFRSLKRAKVEASSADVDERNEGTTVTGADCTDPSCILPSSHVLLRNRLSIPSSCTTRQLLESDVGITEYVSRDVPPICGIIKQRFTDFLVFEVDQDHQVVHLKTLDKPASSKKDPNLPSQDTPAEVSMEAEVLPLTALEKDGSEDVKAAGPSQITHAGSSVSQVSMLSNQEAWGDAVVSSLSPYFSDESIAQLRKMFLESPEPPRVNDNNDFPQPDNGGSSEQPSQGKQGRDRHTRPQGSKKQRGRGDLSQSEKVFSNPISSKTDRTAVHVKIRELFKGSFETETEAPSDQGSRIIVMWSRQGRGRGSGGGQTPGARPPRGEFPPYIHFTMQKTNRDTQDALAYLSRTLHVNVKDFGVAGTKDKRGVTVQRVSLRRGNKTVEDIWKTSNQIGRRSVRDALSQRGDHGIRITDMCYRKAGLELGMLKGNEFIITLRNLQADAPDTVERVMDSLKYKGFINYYGMQRFGTAAVPTHTIGLALLKSDWHKAVSLILQVRPGEHPDVVQARQAWLVDRDLDRALALMPRRVVAERCILESYKKQGGETRNALGALSTIPRNLRLMYIHAYQSYVWNAVVSERIRICGCERAVPGDLVFEEASARKSSDSDEEMNDSMMPDETTDQQDGQSSRSKKKQPWVPPKIITLTTENAHKYSIFDVVMPLPGRDVAYPGGSLGERYREFLKKDGLDPDNFLRKQKEYTLNGSYRKIFQLPKNLSWSTIRYTDPDVSLAQADEDNLLGFDPPRVVEDGKFLALQLNLTLGTAAYATMALRELTKTETSSHFQTGLTQASEDQLFRGTVATAQDVSSYELD
ncbi:tRNA pseudouridine synthase D [Pisolithus orientalis]|uniref:tRNA pseudouridine synthase D n=1 Tax=Pisolithus orientalis TaxID=936130 RepID=UPI00222556FB|nr:tRNA pseudouridine synthase D [Pisolithus orientalis]KAI6035142.1 tRNA pseudouridine synthase D [Pisolithus orientalis]